MAVTVGVREFRAKLSTFLDRVKDGEEVVVTERGKPVARLAPYERDVLAELIAQGRARPPLRPKTKLKPPRGRPLARPNLSDTVIEGHGHSL